MAIVTPWHRPRAAAGHRPCGAWRARPLWLAVVCTAAIASAVTVRATTQLRLPPPPAWTAALDRDHPLVGKLWAVERGLFQPLELLAREIVFEDFVLLGEVHDNPDHHRLRAWVIGGAAGVWLGAGAKVKPAAAVFEHIRVGQLPVGMPDAADTPTALMQRLEWEKSGWPAAALFEPLFAAVIGAGMPIAAGDAPRERIRDVAKGGLTTLAAGEVQRLGLATAPPAPLQDALLTELEASHCGMMPKSAFGAMADAQRYRDATLADGMITAAAAAGGAAVLFAGNGHVRADRAVPAFLKARAPDKKIVAVLFLEVEAGKTDPAAYVPRAPDGKPAADFIVFTPRTERPDPCEEMRAMMAARKK